jgi:hypothetical protein
MTYYLATTTYYLATMTSYLATTTYYLATTTSYLSNTTNIDVYRASSWKQQLTGGHVAPPLGHLILIPPDFALSPYCCAISSEYQWFSLWFYP